MIALDQGLVFLRLPHSRVGLEDLYPKLLVLQMMPMLDTLVFASLLVTLRYV